MATLSPTQGSSTSPIATLACTQGSGTSLPDTLAPSYTPNDLNKFSKRWMKELPSVVWSVRTTSSRATGFSPFFLVYGVEAILPTDLEYGSPRTKAYDDRSNQTSREDSLDQLEEAWDVALLHSARF
jgi:hypothetical protein